MLYLSNYARSSSEDPEGNRTRRVERTEKRGVERTELGVWRCPASKRVNLCSIKIGAMAKSSQVPRTSCLVTWTNHPPLIIGIAGKLSNRCQAAFGRRSLLHSP